MEYLYNDISLLIVLPVISFDVKTYIILEQQSLCFPTNEMTRNIKRMRRISLISVFYLCNLLHKYNAMVLLSS